MGMRNHNLSEKELRTADRRPPTKEFAPIDRNKHITAYERTNKWVNQSAGGGYDFYKKQAKQLEFRKETEPREIKSHSKTSTKGGINGIISQMNKLTSGFL